MSHKLSVCGKTHEFYAQVSFSRHAVKHQLRFKCVNEDRLPFRVFQLNCEVNLVTIQETCSRADPGSEFGFHFHFRVPRADPRSAHGPIFPP